jgi:nitrogen fixation NifU-like protein
LSPELIEHFRNPRNVGELDAPALSVEVSNPVCGDILRLSVLSEDGRITAARYKVRGCTASIATGSALTELVIGKTAEELKALTKVEIEQAVGGLSNESKHAAQLAQDAVRALSLMNPCAL